MLMFCLFSCFNGLSAKRGGDHLHPFHSSVENAWSFKRLSCPTIPSKVVIDEIFTDSPNQTQQKLTTCKDQYNSISIFISCFNQKKQHNCVFSA